MTNPVAVSEPPLYDDAGWPELPDVIPDWVLEQGPLPEPFDCGCHAEDPQPEVGWAIPGVTGRSTQPALPPVSPAVASLQQAADALSATDPSRLPSAQALVDSEALLALEQQLRVHNLRRVGDVSARGLHDLVGYRTARTWLRAHRPDGDETDATLSTSLRDFPVLRRSVEDGTCPLAAARKVVHALRRCWHHVDRPDGLIDGQPADQVIPAVVRNVVTLVARYLLGLADDDPRLAELVARAEDILAAGGSELQQLEAAFTFLAEEVPARSLTAHLEELVLAVLPSVLEERAENDRAGLTLVRKDDGTGWHVSGDLDLECGERLYTALTAEASRDPQNRTDTQAWCTLREQGDDSWAVDVLARPRHKRRRLHDALNRLLARYLEHGLGGTAGKV
ncbi:MAG: hypothetical protein JWN87_2447, partial [Frankiales bacterium]|nr:hypothetical protein [Frankiales bacterium]